MAQNTATIHSAYQAQPTSFALALKGFDALTGNDIVNELDRQADRLAPRFSYECLESACTNARPGDDQPRRQKVWDLHAEALTWNLICSYPELWQAAKDGLARNLNVVAASDFTTAGQCIKVATAEAVTEWADRIRQTVRAYDEAGIAWTTSGGKVWPSGSEYDAECEPCVKGFAHIHPSPQAPLFEVVAEVAYDAATDALVPQVTLNPAEQVALAAGDGTLRCPECDTYSGHFTQDSNGEVIHSICGRSGSPASYIRGTTAYDQAAGDDNGWGDGDADEGYTSPSWGDEGQGGEADEDEALGQAARTFAAALSTQAWADLAPHLSCREAVAAAAFLFATDHEVKANALLEAHAASDEEGDAHWQG
jgi:hypothetical protein